MNPELSSQKKGTQHQMFSMIEEQQSGKMTVKEFCEGNRISEARFYYWRKKYMDVTKAGNELPFGGFRLLHIDEESQKDAMLFAEYRGMKLYQQVPVSYLKELMS
jgi:hypothetical protein